MTTLTSPFWTAYNRYIAAEAKAQGVDLLQPFNSEFDTSKQITGVQNAITLGAKGLIFSPFESAAASTILKSAEKAKVAVVAVDMRHHRPGGDRGARRRRLWHQGVQILAAITSPKGGGADWEHRPDQWTRPRRRLRLHQEQLPKLKLLEIPTKVWSGEDAASGLDTVLNSTPDLKAIYMHAGGVFLAPTLQTLKRKGMLKIAGQPGHIVIVSNDGIPQEFDAIRKGEADATVSQPADLYAKYGIQYLKEAIGGKTFAAGPTDHDSKIVQVAPGVLEDQLGAPLVTKENVDDKRFWGNQPDDRCGPMIEYVASGGHATARPPGPAPIVEAVSISKRFGATVALADVGIRVVAGESHALVGRNGAGKSTLVGILTGLRAADAGEIRFSGALAPPVADREAWRSLVACVYQHSTIIPDLTVAENLFVNRPTLARHHRLARAAPAGARTARSLESACGERAPATSSRGAPARRSRARSYGTRFIILTSRPRNWTAKRSPPFGRMRELQAAG